jgi:hypothetical protein
MNQWVTQNQWIHKSEIQSFAAVKKAQMPILEYNSKMEMSSWAQDVRSWMYKTNTSAPFATTLLMPPRFELEPIKGYVVDGTNRYIYLFDKTKTVNRDIDYTDTFKPGFKFNETNDIGDVKSYTVISSEYREVTSTEAGAHSVLNSGITGAGYMVTVVHIVETYAPLSHPYSTPSNYARLEPVLTSQGDLWAGYHAHWVLDTSSFSAIAAAPQSWDIPRRRSSNQDIVPVAAFGVIGVTGILYIGESHQEITVTVASVTLIPLVTLGTYGGVYTPGLMYNPSQSTPYAIPHSGNIRVYLNGHRQYDSYTEQTALGTPNFTVVGFQSYTTQQIPYVTGIQFNTPLALNDVVRIEVGPAAFGDMGMTAIPVRTIQDDTTFASALTLGTQPTYNTLVQYRQVEQVKVGVNQYPMFNMYNVATSDIIDASYVFSFSEDPAYPVNIYLAKRIVVSDDGREYQFTQHLLDTDDHLIYAYRNTSGLVDGASPIPQHWWFDPITQQLKGWDGKAWTGETISYDPVAGTILVRDVISGVNIRPNNPPSSPTYISDLWYNTKTNVLLVANTLSTWIPLGVSVYVGADPTLQTIWRQGIHGEQFVPQYVDSNRNPIAIGSSSGDWQMPAQWIFNPEHNNKSTVLMSELSTHVGTIISQQPKLPGLMSGGVFSLTQEEINYGVGGTIKEHNDGFDTLVSSFNVSNNTPVGVIEFAESEYASNLLFVQEIYKKNIVSLMSQHTSEVMVDISSIVSSSIITAYEQNQYTSEVYADTSAYDAITLKGVQHWISTSPMFGFAAKYVPYLNIGNTSVELHHHDGHRSQIVVSSAEADMFARNIIATPDPRRSSGTLGISSTSPVPATLGAFTAAFGTLGLLPGAYWYKVGGGLPVLYRQEAYTISPIWKEVNFQTLLAEVYLEIETRLYNATPDYNTTQFEYQLAGISVQSSPPSIHSIGMHWYDTSFNLLKQWNGTVWNTVSLGAMSPLVLAAPPAQQASEQAVYNVYRLDQFNAFVVERHLSAPLVNTSYLSIDAFTWNYVSSVVTTPPNAVPTPLSAASWQEVYTRWYGTPYPHLEPWALQGFTNKPSWWEAQYADSTNVRRWKAAMWTDIIAGNTPHGSPPTTAPTYTYVSVNIGSTSTVDGYGPDQLLPPYYASSPTQQSLGISSLYTNYGQIIAPAADYAFGDVGPTEWMWTTSVQYVYDQLIMAFKMQPVRFMHYAFGPQYVTVGGLQVEATLKQVYAHQNTLFHGDLYDTNQVYLVRGLNQWYVNYNRYTGFDTNDHFRQQWSNWTPRLTYQVGGIMDEESLSVSNCYFDINNQDYTISLVNTGSIHDIWVDAFEVSVLSMPPALSQYNSQGGWKLELSALAPTPRTLTCYGAKVYSCIPDVSAGGVNILRYSVISASSMYQQFVIPGDQTSRCKVNSLLVASSITNNGTFTVQQAIYQPSSNSTLLSVLEPVFDAPTNGYLDLQGMVVSWNTGDRVALSSTMLLPAPLLPNTAYYVIKTSNNTYMLAESPQDAFANLPVMLTSAGSGIITIAEVESTFTVFGGVGNTKDIWYHYVLDTTDVYTITPPYSFMSMQTLINILDGYSVHQQTQGLLYGVGEGNNLDPNTGRTVDWQLETERFIDWAYGLRNTRVNISDKYGATVGVSSTSAAFSGAIPQWAVGTQVVVNSTGSLPAPLLLNTPYYYQPSTTPETFQLSVTANIVDLSNLITFSSSGVGSLFISLYNVTNVFPTFEINPTRNQIWIDTPRGVLANVVDGPYSDIQIQQTIFDQYGRPLQADKLVVYRDDKQSHIVMRPTVTNDVDPSSIDDPYNYIHFGGSHLFVEGYEHYIIFNDTTVGGNLIYNPFLGLYASRFDVNFYEKKDYSLRPTLGGYFLQDGKYLRNIEGTASDLSQIYDLQSMTEMSVPSQHARALVGYVGRLPSLDLINLDIKSQFIFYRGMIRAKGSVNSVQAYINSRRFVDAQVDECWAWKVSNIGDIRTRIYPEIKLFVADSLASDIRLEFLATSELPTDPDVQAAVAQGFQLVSFSDGSRWNNFPEQKSDIVTPLFLDAEVTDVTVIYSGLTTPTSLQVIQGRLQYWFDGMDLREWTGTTWSAPVLGKVVVSGSFVYFKHDTICDDVRMYRHTLSLIDPTDFTDYTTNVFTTGTGADEYIRVNAEVVRTYTTNFTDIIVIFSINASQKKISPAQLTDIKSHVVVQDVPLWHPALGYHYPIAIHNVDLQLPGDPALYQTSLSNVSTNAWHQVEVGTVWLDTNSLGYTPYYDNLVYPNIDDRLAKWGNLAPWASVNVCKWTKSTVPPSQWDAVVKADANNSSILQNDKATGVPRQTLFNRIRTPIPNATVTPGTGGTAFVHIPTTIVDGDSVLFTSAPTILSVIPAIYGTDLIGAINTSLSSSATNVDLIGTATIAFTTTSPTPSVELITLLRIPSGAYTFELNIDRTGSSVTSVGTIVPGSLYTPGTYANVALIGGTGHGATANVTITGAGTVTVVEITNGGINYTLGDVLSAASISIGGGDNIIFGAFAPGSLYTDGIYNNVPLTGGAGNGATATITVAGGAVISAVPSIGGIGYTTGNTLTTSQANIGAGVYTFGTVVASALFTDGVYSHVPLIGGHGTNATTTVTVSGGNVTSIAVTPNGGGTGYVIGDVLTGTVSTLLGGHILAVGTLAGGTLYSNGSYTNVPLTGGHGSGATASIVVAGGAVASATIILPGTGYTVGDTLSVNSIIVGNSIASLNTLVGGSLYVYGTYYNVPLTGGHGSGALATIVVTWSGFSIGGVITSVVITSAGTGYVVGDILTATIPNYGSGSAWSVRVASIMSGSGFILPVVTVSSSSFTVPVNSVSGSGFNVTVGTTIGSGFQVPVTSTNTVYTVNATGSDTLGSMAALMSTAAGIPVSVVGNAFVITTGTIGRLPTGLLSSTKYTALHVQGLGPYTFQVQDQSTQQLVDILDTGNGTMTVIPAFKPTSWSRHPLIHERLYNIFDIPVFYTGTITLKNLLWTAGDTADVYVNGTLVAANAPVTVSVATTVAVINLILAEKDIVDVIRPLHVLTSVEAAFNPDFTDDGTVNVQWKRDYEYTSNITIRGSTTTGLTTSTNYYFWVEGATNTNQQDRTSLSTFATAQQLQTIPTPYFVVQDPQDDPTMVEMFGYGLVEYGSVFAAGTTAEQFFIVPVLYRQAVLCNIANYITEDNRYVIRFLRDLTLRDNLRANGKEMNLKDKHEEWQIFRELQPSAIPTKLWNKLVEAAQGYTIVNTDVGPIDSVSIGYAGTTYTNGVYTNVPLIGPGSSAAATVIVSGSVVTSVVITTPGVGYKVGEILTAVSNKVGGTGSGFCVIVNTVVVPDPLRVPSLERQLYDARYGTNTQYGLDPDQAFVNGGMALTSILAYLENPHNNFYPVDMDSFFARNNFNSPTAVYAAMMEIYNTFPVSHVNAIWFETLRDALTTKPKYKDLMKTSWVVLHGVRVLEVGGGFND